MQTAEQTAHDPNTGEVAPSTLAKAAPAALVGAPATSRAALMRATMEAETEIRALVKEYVGRHMVEGTDYGVIPGTKKPTLLKPGAEKLVDLFSVEPIYEVVTRLEDWDRGRFHYELRCQLKERTSGLIRAEGMGSANSLEARYRWRQGERLCPQCGKATIIKGKADYGGGWLCFAKKGGCGAKFPDKATEIVDQVVGKIENDDPYTLVNTILKMGKKRALVDASIALARCSDIFTQDVEDLVDAGHEVDDRTQSKAQPESGNKPKARAVEQAKPAPKKRPVFSKSAQWPGAEQWASRPLDEAGLDTLLEYYESARAGLEACEDDRIALLLKEHMRAIEDVIATKEPKVERERDPGAGDEAES